MKPSILLALPLMLSAAQEVSAQLILSPALLQPPTPVCHPAELLRHLSNEASFIQLLNMLCP